MKEMNAQKRRQLERSESCALSLLQRDYSPTPIGGVGGKTDKWR